jgi:antitoxin FitA
MPEVLVRNLDEAVLKRLKARARSNGRSLQAELRLILEQAAQGGSTANRATYRALAERIRRALGPGPHSDSAKLLAEDRRR